MPICQNVLDRLQKRFDENIQPVRFEAFSSTLKKTRTSESGKKLSKFLSVQSCNLKLTFNRIIYSDRIAWSMKMTFALNGEENRTRTNLGRRMVYEWVRVERRGIEVKYFVILLSQNILAIFCIYFIFFLKACLYHSISGIVTF